MACIGYAAGFVISMKTYVCKLYVDAATDKAAGSDDDLECTLLLAFILINRKWITIARCRRIAVVVWVSSEFFFF